MNEPRYSVTRGRSGRFNFTLLSGHGRITGSVRIELREGQSRAAMNEAVRRKIEAVTGELIQAINRSEAGALGEP